MLLLLSIPLLLASLILATAIAIIFLEVVAAMRQPRQFEAGTPARTTSRVSVLVPAHNESGGLRPTLADIKAQLGAGDQLLVVADNCTDDTAAIALAAGASVTRRDDPERRGKGYALAWGFDHLRPMAPDVVIVIDADCRVADGTIARLADLCMQTQRPVQALDLMIAPKNASVNFRLMEFAWRVKNWVRPLGLKAAGLPCQLMGTGMAFPWDRIRSVDTASGSLVEDLKLGLDFALLKCPPLFCPSAVVTSEFPTSVEGVKSQQMRWQQGHIGMILTTIPRLIPQAIRQRNSGLLILALDAAVPPLALLAMLATGMVLITGAAALLGMFYAAFLISAASLAVLTASIALSWFKFGRDIVRPSEFQAIFSYVAKKLLLYGTMMFRKSGGQWIRTDRRKS